MATQPHQFLTPGQYLELERNAQVRSEYAKGELFALSGNTRTHNRLAVNIENLLSSGMARQSDCERFTSDMKVSIRNRQRYCYPDITVCCGQAEFEDAVEDVLLNPTVIFEVLSKKTMGYDLGDKSFYYRQLPTLRHIVLVWHDRTRVGHWHRTQEEEVWKYAEYEAMEESIALVECQLDLNLNDIYDRVNLETR